MNWLSNAGRRLALVAVGVVSATAAGASGAYAVSPGAPVVCASPTVDVAHGATASFTLSCETTDGAPVDSYALVGAPSRSEVFTLDAATGAVTYRARQAATGTDTFTFKGIVDGLGESSPARVTLTLQNARPTCDPVLALDTPHGRSVNVPLSCTDADGDALTYAAGIHGAAHGTVVITGSTVVYTPTAGFVGTDSFSLVADDAAERSQEVEVSVEVTNAAPTCSAGIAAVHHDRSASLTPVCSDADGDPLTLQVQVAPQQGTAVAQGQTLRYTPSRGYVGNDVLWFKASDGLGTSAATPYALSVTNEVPVCSAHGTFVARGAQTVPFTCSDDDDDAVRVRTTQAPRHGRIALVDGRTTYLPDAGFTGQDSFSLAATDGVATTSSQAFSVRVLSSRARVASAAVSRGDLVLGVSCPATSPCRGSVRFVSRGHRVVTDTKAFTVTSGHTAAVVLDLSKRELKVLRAQHGAGRVEFTARDVLGQRDAYAQSVTVRTR